MKRYAAIDIGTNTILMLIGEIKGQVLSIIRDEHSIARLGQGVDAKGNICMDAIKRATDILTRYNKICKEMKVDNVKICGTSALRDANNREEVINEFLKVIDAEVEIISGEREARLSYLGTIEDIPDENNLVIDIGGGSTEFINGTGPDYKSRKSLQIGAVRLTERYVKNNPPLKEEVIAVRNEIIKHLGSIDSNDFDFQKLYAVAGTPTTVAAIALGLKDFERDKIHGYRLSYKMTKEIFETLSKIKIEEIIDKYHVNPKRADLILAGILILLESLKHFKTDSFIVSIQGLRYGLLKDMIK